MTERVDLEEPLEERIHGNKDQRKEIPSTIGEDYSHPSPWAEVGDYDNRVDPEYEK